ncbi:MAG: Trp biosynthesis-associated membrane protein, partial [Herbiconiux sp.]|nr:Trp biosynthesis-associated membrane protein [Herbiconiux sp.]
MTGRRLKTSSILLVLALSALTFLAWSQSWGTLTIVGGGGSSGNASSELVLDVPGSAAAPALSALGLAGIALAGALAIAGPVIRIVLGLLQVLLGASVLWSALGALLDPVAAGASVVTTSTGVAGTASIRDLVTPGGETPWPAVTVVLGALMVLTGLLVVVTVRRWPQSSRRYQAVTFEAADGRRSTDPAELFDDEPATDATGTTDAT